MDQQQSRALISRVGWLRKWMGTDWAEMGAPGVPMSRLLRVSIGRELLFLIFWRFIAISSHLFAQFACQNLPPDFLSLLLRGIVSCFPNYSSFLVLSQPRTPAQSCSVLFKQPIHFLKIIWADEVIIRLVYRQGSSNIVVACACES